MKLSTRDEPVRGSGYSNRPLAWKVVEKEKPKITIAFRPLVLDDLEMTRKIYNYAVTSTLATLDLEPRTVGQQERWINEHQGIYTAIAALADGAFAGFASISPYRPRPGYSSTVEDSIYLDHHYWGMGIGKALLAELLAIAKDLGFHSCIANIVADHHASIALHQRLGFRLVGIQEEIGRKFGRWVDLAILQKML